MIKDFKLTKKQKNLFYKHKINLTIDKTLIFKEIITKSKVKALLTKLKKQGIILTYTDKEKTIKSITYDKKIKIKSNGRRKVYLYPIENIKKEYHLTYYSAFTMPKNTINFPKTYFQKITVNSDNYDKRLTVNWLGYTFNLSHLRYRQLSTKTPEIIPFYKCINQVLDAKYLDNYWFIQETETQNRIIKQGKLDHIQYNDNFNLINNPNLNNDYNVNKPMF